MKLQASLSQKSTETQNILLYLRLVPAGIYPTWELITPVT